MTSQTPQLLYVNSKIIKPAELSKDLFTSWYNDVHIPDIFATSGIGQAFRYITTASDPDSVERPYLAIYPVTFTGYLWSEEFQKIPVVSDVLPGPNHEIFDVADFDTRYYRTLREDSVAFMDDPYLLTVQYDLPLENEPCIHGRETAVFECYFSRQNRKAPEDSEIGTPPSHLRLIWYGTEENMNDAADAFKQTKARVARFKLLKAFEREEKPFGEH